MEEHFTLDSMLFTFLFTTISVGYVLSVYSGYPFKKSVFLEFFFLLYIVLLIIFNVVAFCPDSITSNYSVIQFFIYNARTPFLEKSFIQKWIIYSTIGGLATFFLGRVVRYYNFSLNTDKIKEKLKIQKIEKRKANRYNL